MLSICIPVICSLQQPAWRVSCPLGSRVLLRLLTTANVDRYEQSHVPCGCQQPASSAPETLGPAAAAITNKQPIELSVLQRFFSSYTASKAYELVQSHIGQFDHTGLGPSSATSSALWQSSRQYGTDSSRSNPARRAAVNRRYVESDDSSESEDWRPPPRVRETLRQYRGMQQWQPQQQQWQSHKQQYQLEDSVSSDDDASKPCNASRQHNHNRQRPYRTHQQQQLHQHHHSTGDAMRSWGGAQDVTNTRRQPQQTWRQQEQRSGHKGSTRRQKPWLASESDGENYPSRASVYSNEYSAHSRDSRNGLSTRYQGSPGAKQRYTLTGNAQNRTAVAGPMPLEPAALTTAIKKAKSLTELQKLLQNHKDNLQQINVCAAYKAVVCLSVPNDSKTSNSGSGGKADKGSVSSSKLDPVALAIMRQLSSRMLSHIRAARPWDLAQAAWACSKLQYRDQALLNAIAQQTMRKAPILLPQDVSQLASAYARLSFPHKQLMQFLQQQTLAKADDFEPWSLIHTAWSLEVAGAPGSHIKQLLTVISRQIGAQESKELQPLDVATLLWLMASHEYFSQELLDVMVQQLTAQISRYPPPAVAQALMSVAGLGYQSPELAEAAAPVVLQHLQQQQYSPKQVAHTTFALVKLGPARQELLEAASAAFVSSGLGSYSPPLLCMMCWAMNLGSYRSENFNVKLLQETSTQFHKFTADQVASIVRGVLKLPGESAQAQVAQLLTTAAQQLPEQLASMSTSVLGRLVVALGKHRQLLQQQYTAQTDAAYSNCGVEDGHEQHMEPVMLQLMQQCGQEWVQPRRQGQVTKSECSAVSKALAAANLRELLELAEQVSSIAADDAHQSSSQVQKLAVGVQSVGGSSATKSWSRTAGPTPSASAQPGSWVDSFVANSDDA